MISKCLPSSPSIDFWAIADELPLLFPFVLLWSTLIYCPLAHMVWAKGGFLGLCGGLGALDLPVARSYTVALPL